MATPEFIVALRKKIGHDLLWLPGVSLVVVDDDGRLLLGRRSDNGQWAVISGIPEPGEQPAAAAVRECAEETGVDAEVLAVAGVGADKPFAFPNGDNCAFMDITFVGRPRPGAAAHAHAPDEEPTQVGWSHPDSLPEPLAPPSPARIQAALAWLADPTSGARFQL